MARAYPWTSLARRRFVQDTLGARPLVVFWQPGVLSALDRPEIARSRDVGVTGVYSPIVDGRLLTFTAAPDGFRDRETGTTWNLLGHAVRGPLAGRRLTPLPHADAFWFAWAAFHPETSVHE